MENRGKLIVFEGTDGSGKSTQFAKLCSRIEAKGKDFRRLVFPQYEEESSALIRMYLRGEFGKNPGDVDPYAATAFYAVDRYASYKKLWGSEYEAGGLMMADRYTTSNAVHQASKLEGEERLSYVSFLFDFEYNKMGLPKPDLVLYLDMPTEKSLALIKERQGAEDIHEADGAYLAKCRDAALETAKNYGWVVISSLDKEGNLRSIDEIHEEVWTKVLPLLE